MFNKSSALILISILFAAINSATKTTALDPPAAASAATGEVPVLELYMHDILGGSSPTARPITGLLGNIYNGQVPFARPLGFLPPKDGVAIPNSNGAIPTINPSGIPLGTGLVGTAFAGINNNNGQNINTAQLGPDGLGLGFGTITVIDDYLTSAPSWGHSN
ncbi:UNVERIFIED_CONTAM: Dirigent protein 18 [Sesamum latifolium]|uniref:Dirigent protein 18 n=1 Tax=Sesamum latifolium TaxID=2727402 RepID=A0AAW2XKV5_9LAMI